MTATWLAMLEDRGVVSVKGADARKLLQGLITNDLDRIAAGGALHAALLTPQGKILFAFFVLPIDGGYLLETNRDCAVALARRLAFYKLRAAVEIADATTAWQVAVAWGGPFPTAPGSPGAWPAGAIVFADPRHAGLGQRILLPAAAALAATQTAAGWHAWRIGLGVPEAGSDYVLGDTVPHEADFDLFNGVDFDKGCFVGQEVVARMQHKSVVRKRVVRVTGAMPLPAGHPDVIAGKATIGRLGSVSGSQGLAMLRLDRAAESIDSGDAILAGGVELEVDGTALQAYRNAVAARAGAV